MTELHNIEEVCAGMREIFERILGTTSVDEIAGTCLHASILLQQSIDKFCGSESVVRGGDGDRNGGLKDTSGRIRGHYWVEGVTGSGIPFVADITSDQFEWPPVVVMPLQTARERYIPGDEAAVGSAVDEELRRMLRSMSGNS
ncbi:hypothetical protein [Paraburkholderia caribensis]|uniref:hypothetical protein n=1 Tax=Paraburkholderia caribensis TaxID=75105 RepID=UPI00159144BE|nr:hypothetical protein [Paraburkholderia caribensis]